MTETCHSAVIPSHVAALHEHVPSHLLKYKPEAMTSFPHCGSAESCIANHTECWQAIRSESRADVVLSPAVHEVETGFLTAITAPTGSFSKLFYSAQHSKAHAYSRS